MVSALADRYRRLLTGLVHACGRVAVWLLLANIVATAGIGWYAFERLSVDTDTAGMLDPNLPFMQRSRALDREFPQYTDLILVVVDGTTPAAAEDAAAGLSGALARNTERFKSVYRPGAGKFFARNGLLFLSTSELWDLSDRLAEAEPFFGTLADDPSLRGVFAMLGRALGEKLSDQNEKLFGGVLNDLDRAVTAQVDGRPYSISWRGELLGGLSHGNDKRQFILVQPRLDYNRLRPGQRALDSIRETAARLNLDQAHGVKVGLTGPVAMSDEEMQSVDRGARIATVLSFVLVCVVLVVGLRSPRVVLSVLLTLASGLVWTAGYAALAIGHLNLISVTFAVLFIGLGVDFGIQFSMRYLEELSRGGRPGDALGRAAAGVGNALTLAAVAAAISFFAFAPTSYRGLAELGIIAGSSMFIALFANLTVLPAWLTVLHARRAKPLPPRGDAPLLGRFLQRHARPVVWGALVLGVAAAAVAPRARFDFNPVNLQDPNTESVATFMDLLRDPDTTPYTIQVLTPDLDAARKLAARLDRLPEVDHTVTLDSFVPSHQQEKLDIIDQMSLLRGTLGGYGTERPPPTTAEQVAALHKFQARLERAAQQGGGDGGGMLAAGERRLARSLARLEKAPGWPEPAIDQLQRRLVNDLPHTLARLRELLDPQHVTLQSLPAGLRARYVAPDGRARVQVFPNADLRSNTALRRFVHAVQQIAPDATDAPVTLVEGGRAVIEACQEAALLAVLAASVLLLVVLRSVLDTILVLLPLALAALLTVATSVVLDLPFNFANVISMPLLLGLGIAFGIYMIMRDRAEHGLAQVLGSSTPRAVLLSVLTTICSFGTLAFSPHRGMSSMGLLLTIALSFALLFSVVVLPAAIHLVDPLRRGNRARTTPSSDGGTGTSGGASGGGNPVAPDGSGDR